MFLFRIVWELQIRIPEKGKQWILAGIKEESRTCVVSHQYKRMKLSLRSQHIFPWNIHTWEKRQIKQITGAFSPIQHCCHHYEQAASGIVAQDQ